MTSCSCRPGGTAPPSPSPVRARSRWRSTTSAAAAPGDTTRTGSPSASDVAGQRLLADAIGDPGRRISASTCRPTAAALPVSYLCSGGPKDAWLHISVNGGGAVFGGGCDDSTLRPGRPRRRSPATAEAAEARSMHVRMWVTHGQKGDMVEDPDLRHRRRRVRPGARGEPPGGLAGHRRRPSTTVTSGAWWTPRRRRRAPASSRCAASPGQETLVEMSFARTGPGVVRTLEDGGPGSLDVRRRRLRVDRGRDPGDGRQRRPASERAPPARRPRSSAWRGTSAPTDPLGPCRHGRRQVGGIPHGRRSEQVGLSTRQSARADRPWGSLRV